MASSFPPFQDDAQIAWQAGQQVRGVVEAAAVLSPQHAADAESVLVEAFLRGIRGQALLDPEAQARLDAKTEEWKSIAIENRKTKEAEKRSS